MNLFFDKSYVVKGRDTTRKSEWISQSLLLDPVSNVEIISPPALDESLLARVHGKEYVDAVRSGLPIRLAESQGFDWSPDIWRSATASTMGVVAAARHSLLDRVAGSLSSGLHHAKYARGDGFCTFNGLIVAAEYLNQLGVKDILIIDLDAHFGGGTNALLAGREYVHHIDVSVVGRFDAYPIFPHRNTAGPRPIRMSLLHEDAETYLHRIKECLQRAEERAAESGITFGACIYNAGVDPHEDCPLGGLGGITSDILRTRDRMVFEWCKKQGIPASFALAGGYIGPAMSQKQLVDLHRATIEEAASVYR